MNLLDRFRQALGPEKTDELLKEAKETTDALDKQGVERKNADGAEAATGGDQPSDADLAALKTLIDDQVKAALEAALPAALEKVATAWADETVKALTEQRTAIEADMKAQIEALTAQVTKATETQDAITGMMPRALQDAQQRASKAADTVTDGKKTGDADPPPAPTDAKLPFFDGLALDQPNGNGS